MQVKKAGRYLVVLWLFLGIIFLQTALAQDKNLTDRRNQVVISSQSHQESAQIALEEMRSIKLNMEKELKKAKAAGQEEKIQDIESRLEKIDGQIKEIKKTVQAIQAQHDQVMDLASKAEEAISDQQAKSALVAAEAITNCLQLFYLNSAQNSLETVVQYQAGNLDQAKKMANKASGLLKSSQDCQNKVKKALTNLGQEQYAKANTLASQALAECTAPGVPAEEAVAGGPGQGPPFDVGELVERVTERGRADRPSQDLSDVPRSDDLDDVSPSQ